MSYLLDKRKKRKKYTTVAIFIFAILIIFYFRNGLFNGLSFVGSTIFRPVLIAGRSIGGKFGGVGAYFSSKSSLSSENESLRNQLLENNALVSNYNSVVSENNILKDTLGRKDENMDLVLAAILAKPNQSAYDILVVDVGANRGISVGNTVFAFGGVPIGKVSDVFPSSSKVTLFSTSGEKTQGILGANNTFMEVLGRGGGNFEIVLPRDFSVVNGDQVVLPGITPRVFGIVETVISDPRDSFIKALLVSPVNVQELKFVEVAR